MSTRLTAAPPVAPRHPVAFLAGPEAAAYRLTARDWLILLVFGATLLGIGLGSARVLTQHEVMFAEPAREMLATGDWITPRLAGVPFNDKPPLTAWTIAALMALTGSESAWVVRLPALASALITAAWIAALGARWFGRRVGLVAGLMQCSSFYVLMQARLAESDMPFCACVTTALAACGLVAVEGPLPPRSERGWRWLFFLAAALAFLTKGPLGLALVFPPVVVFALWQGQPRLLGFLVSPLGWLLFAGVALSWPIMAYLDNPTIGRDWVMHNLDRFRGRMDDGGAGGRKPPLFYFYIIPSLVLPWTVPLLFAAIRGARQGRWTTPAFRFAASWFLPGLAILCLSVWKHKHYAIPILPPLSWLAAHGVWTHLIARQGKPGPVYGWPILAAVWLGLGGAVVPVALLARRGGPAIGGLLVTAALGLTVFWHLARQRRLNVQLVALFATLWLVGVGVQLGVMPAHDSYRAVTEFAHRTNARVPDQVPVHLLGMPVHQVAFYLDPPLVRIDNPELALNRLAEVTDRPVYAMLPRYLADLAAARWPCEFLDQSATLHRHSTERERLTLVRLPARATAATASDAAEGRR